MNKNIIICLKWLKKGGGAEKVTLKIANTLVSRGWDVSVFIVYDTDSEHEISSGINLVRCGSYLSMFKKVLPYKGVIFAADHKIAIYLSMIRIILRLNYKLLFRSITNLNMIFETNMLKKLAARCFLSKSDGVIAQSYGMKNELCDFFNIPKDNVVVIHNPNSEVEERYYKNEDREFLLFVGRLSKEKWILEFLLPAFKKIVEDYHPEVILKIAGDGNQKELIREYIKNNSLSNSVILLGYTDNLPDLYSKAKLTILTSKYEGFPNTLVESISYGTPIVAFDSPHGPRDIVEDGINGFIAKYSDFDDLVIMLNKAIDFNFDNNAVHLSSKKFSKANFDNHISAFFEKLQ